MLEQAFLSVLASLIFYLVCRYVIFRRPIITEDANKVLVLFMLLAVVVLIISN